MYCGKCGIEIKEDAKFCQQCGDPVEVRETESIAAAVPVSNGGKNVPDVPDFYDKDGPTISALLNSLADGSFRKASPPRFSRMSVSVIAMILGIILIASGAWGYWHWKHKSSSSADHGTTEKTTERPISPFVIERSTDRPATAYSPVRHAIKGKVKKKTVVKSEARTEPREEKPSADDHKVGQAQNVREASRDENGSWLNRSPGGPPATPPSRDPRETGF